MESKKINSLIDLWSISMDMKLGGNTANEFVDQLYI